MKEGDCRGEVNQIRLILTYEEWDFMRIRLYPYTIYYSWRFEKDF